MKYLNPVYKEKDKEVIICMFEEEVEPGVIVSKVMSTSKGDPAYNEILEQYSDQEIEAFSQLRWNPPSKIEKVKTEEEKQAEKQERLFNTKLEVFEIDEIKSSKDRKMKSKIRKAESEAVVYAYAAAMIIKSLDE